MLVTAIWFVVGLLFDRIFLYPLALFFVGLLAVAGVRVNKLYQAGQSTSGSPTPSSSLPALAA